MKRRAVVLALAGAFGVARADAPTERPQAFEVDRDAPPPGRAELGFDAGAPVAGWAASVQLGYLDRPLRLRTATLEVFPVRRRETLALGAAVAIGPAVVVDARLPLAHQVGDRMTGLGDDRPLDRWVIGDLGLGGRLRLAVRGPVQLFARGQLALPSGDDHDHAGEARFMAAWMLIGRFALPAGVVVAGSAGVQFRAREVRVADRLLGDELIGALGVTYALPPLRGVWCEANQVRVTGELVGALGDDVAGQRGPSPVEVRVGMIGRIRPQLGVAARAGAGLNDQIGASRVRAMLEVVYEGGAW